VDSFFVGLAAGRQTNALDMRKCRMAGRGAGQLGALMAAPGCHPSADHH
jgi:hypothetical protein